MTEKMTIEKLAGMDDAELMDALGFVQKMEDAKASIAEMNQLTGKAREEAESRVAEMFAPNVYHNDFKYIVEDSKRKARSGKEEADCCAPCAL